MSDEERTQFLGEKTIARYGCFGCHTISGFEKASPIGTELTEQGSKLVERLDFGYEEGKIAHTLPAWTQRKLMEPRVFDVGKVKQPEELLRMPKFHFTTEEADAIVTAVLSMTQGAGAPGRPEAPLRRRALRGEGPAPGAQLQLPGLPPHRRGGRHLPGHRGGPARELGRRHPPGLRPHRAHPLQREVEDRRGLARPHRLAARLPGQAGEQDPALAGAAHALVPVRRGAAQHHHPLLRGPGRRAPTPTSPSLRSTPPWWPPAATSSAAGSA